MKKIFILMIICCSFFLCGSSYENDLIEKQIDFWEPEILDKNLNENTTDILQYLGIDELNLEDLSELTFDNFLNLLIKSISKNLKEPFKVIFYIISAALVCSLINNFCEGFIKSEKTVNLVAVLASSGIIFIPMKELLYDTVRVIEECSDFMLGFIPVYSSVISATGYISSAMGYRTLMLGAVTIISRIISEIIVPIIGIYLAMCIAGAVSDIKIDEISRYFKNFAVWVLGISMTVFSGILGLGNLISTSTDNAFNKTAKFLIGSAVPVVGNTVSDAITTVKGCLSVTGNVFGIYGIIVTAAIFIPPIISVLIWNICLSASSAACRIIDNKNLYNLISSVSAVTGIMLALLVTTAVMFIFSVAILLITGGAA